MFRSICGNVLSDLYLEEPIEYRRLRVVPLGLRSLSELEYLILSDDSESPVTIEETSTSGTVSEVLVRNRSSQRVLIPEGTTLIGAKQNRAVNLSILLGPDSVTSIPVSCVERGRWSTHSGSFSTSWSADGGLRAMMCGATTASLKSSGKVQVDQGAVWDHVDSLLDESKVTSPTRAYHALYESWEQDLKSYEAHLRVPDRACGVAVELDGLLQSVDLFDQPQTLHKLWPKLVKSYITAALRPMPAQGRKSDLNEFLQRTLSAPGKAFEPVGIGTNVRLTTEEAVGAALFCDSRLVHLSLFASEPASFYPNPPAPVENEPGSERQRPRSRPWWKFWE